MVSPQSVIQISESPSPQFVGDFSAVAEMIITVMITFPINHCLEFEASPKVDLFYVPQKKVCFGSSYSVVGDVDTVKASSS